MLAVERRLWILETLNKQSTLSIKEIAQACDVSSVTARADLDALAQEGKLKRTHGGAVSVSEFIIPKVSDRLRLNAQAKDAIGAYAATLVEDGDTILCGSGSTVLAFIKQLTDKQNLTLITNDCNTLEYVEKYLPHITVVSTGGALGRRYRHFWGPFVAASLRDVYLDKVFMGADGFTADFGFMAEFEQTAFTKMEFMKHARTKILLMDASKVDACRCFVRFAEPKDIDMVIMDKDPKGIVRSACAAQGTTQIIEVAQLQ